MSTDLGITIKVDATQAKPTIDGVHESLGRVEAKGQPAGESVARGMRAGSSAAEKLKESAHEAGEEIGKIDGSFSGAIAGRFGEVGNILGELGTKGTVAAAAIVGLGAEVIHLSDEYAQLENAAAKLAGGTRATNDVLDEQLSLAGDLHASLEQTIELSTVVKERTADLNLTSAQRLELTQALGDAARIENKSMDDAAGVLSRVGFALEAGLPAGRSMKDLMREYPVLADAMHEHFGVSTKTIIEMANKGAISLKDFTDATMEAGNAMHEEAETRAVGLGTRLGHLKDQVIETKFGLELLADAIAPGLRELERQNAATEAHTAEVKKNTEEIMSNVDAVKELELKNSDLVQSLHQVADAMAEGNKILDDNATKYEKSATRAKAYQFVVDDIKERIAEIKKNHPDMPLDQMLGAADIEAIRAAVDAQRHLNDEGEMYGAELEKIHDKEIERARAIEGLDSLLRRHKITQEEYNEAIKQYAHAASAEMQEEQKIMKEMFGVEDELNLRLDALHGLLDRGRISWLEYGLATREALDKAREAKGLPMLSATKGIEIGAPDADSMRNIDAGIAAESAKNPARERAALYSQIFDTSAIEKFKADAEMLNDAERRGTIDAGDHAKLLGELRSKYDDLKTPADEYAKALEKIHERDANGMYDAEHLAGALDKLALQYNRADWGAGMRQGFRDIAEEARGSAKEIGAAMKTAFDGVNEQLTNTITGAKTNWAGLADSVEHDLVKATLHKAESALFDVGPAAATITGAMTVGGLTAGGEIGAAMTLAGSAVALELTAAMSGTSNLAAGTILDPTQWGGAATGGEFDIPHAANGFAGIVRHRSGQDTHIAAFHVREGEHVQIRTPEQQAAAESARGGAGASSAPDLHLSVVMPDNRAPLKEMIHGGEGRTAFLKHMSGLRQEVRAMLGVR